MDLLLLLFLTIVVATLLCVQLIFCPTGTLNIGQFIWICYSRIFSVKIPENKGEKKAPEFLKSLQDIEVNTGSKVKFRVKLKGYPQPRVTWYKDGKRVKNTEQYKIGKPITDNNAIICDYACVIFIIATFIQLWLCKYKVLQ